VEGLGIKQVKHFEQNLKKLEKEVSVSCYDGVSSYFSTMKSQVREVLDQALSAEKERKTQNSKTNPLFM
jgi:hypothetical protein